MLHEIDLSQSPALCRYGTSPLQFRAPPRQFTAPFWAALGGTTTFGNNAFSPYPDIIQDIQRHPCINFGTRDGGLETVLRDPALLTIASAAEGLFLECGPFEHLSNRLYTVHPRQNSRVLFTSESLAELCSDRPLEPFDFARELPALLSASAQSQLHIELVTAWDARLRSFLSARTQPCVVFASDPRFEVVFEALNAEFTQHELLLYRHKSPMTEESNSTLAALLARSLARLLK